MIGSQAKAMPAAAAPAPHTRTRTRSSGSPSAAIGPPLPYWGGAAVGAEEQRWRIGMDSAAAALLDSASASASSANAAGKEMPTARHIAHRTAHNMSSSSLRKKSDLALLRKVPCAPLRRLLDNLQEVLLATKLALLFPAVLLAIAARIFHFGQATPLPPPPPTVIASFFPFNFLIRSEFRHILRLLYILCIIQRAHIFFLSYTYI